jgi:PEP-CTERM motif
VSGTVGVKVYLSVIGEASMRRLVGVGLIVAALLSAAPAQATEITFTTTTVGQTFEVNIMLAGNTSDLIGFAFGFDFSGMQFAGGLAGNLFDGADFFAGDLMGGPTVMGILPSGSEGAISGLLATLTFTLTGLGGPNFSISPSFLLDANFAFVDHAVRDLGTAPVPEPSTLGLMGIGLAALARRLRKRNAASPAVQ